MIKKQCKICGTEFIAKTSQRYCSQFCRQVYQRNYLYEWRKTHQGPIRICKDCGEAKPHQALGLCRKCYSRQRNRKFKKLIQKTCLSCGKEFTTGKFNPYQKFCCSKCTSIGVFVKICEQCGKTYKVTKRRFATSKYCSRSCLAKAQWSNKDQKERLDWSRKLSKIRWSRLSLEERSLAISGRNNPMFGKTCVRKYNIGFGRFRPDLHHYFRSTWEANIVRIFKLLNVYYKYEPENFDLGEVSYTPDFKLTDNYFCEVKGYMRENDKKKIDLFREQHPNKTLFLIDKAVYKVLENEFKEKIPAWE